MATTEYKLNRLTELRIEALKSGDKDVFVSVRDGHRREMSEG